MRKKTTVISAMAFFALYSNATAGQFDCLMDPSLVVEIGSAEVGIIEDISVQRGDIVTKGQLVAKLESGAEQAALDYQATVDAATSQHQQAILELRQAEFEKRLAVLEETRVAAQLSRREIHAPVDGIVITRMIGPGEYVFAQAPVIQIARIDPLHIEVFLPTDLFNNVEIGQIAKVMPAAPIGGEYEAEVIAVDRVFDAASDTFGVRLKMDNPEGRLVAGIDCKIEIAD